MRTFELTHLSDRKLLHALNALVAQDRQTTAALLAHIAEVDARRLYAPAGYDSMYAYCVTELRLSEDAAYKRIRAGRTARRFPAVFAALADGRLNLSVVLLLTPYLTQENAGDLLGAATGKSKSEIELLLAQRFPRTELMPLVCTVPSSAGRMNGQLAPAPVEKYTPAVDADRTKLAPGPVEKYAPEVDTERTKLAPAQVGGPTPRSRVAPIAPQRFMIQASVDQETYDKLRHAQALLSHKLPSGDIAQVLGLALDALITQLEKRKCGATDSPRPRSRPATGRRTIPAHVRRAVWERDRGQCTFASETGHRCGARRFLEFDHVDPVARGGEATVSGMRLRCRAHNQLEAERAFGAGFMDDKREAAHRARAGESAAESDRDVLAALRTLGYRAGEARRAAAFSESLTGSPLEQRVRLALSYFRPRRHSNAAALSP